MIGAIQPDFAAPRPASSTLSRAVILHIRRPILEAALLYITLTICAHVGIAFSRGSELYDLTPHGIGLVFDALILIVFITAIHLFLTFPSRMVRPGIGRVLRALMYGVFVLFIAWLQWQKFVAVRLTPSQLILVRHYPQDPLVIDRATLQPVEIRDTGTVRALEIHDRLQGLIESVPIYHADAKTTAKLAELARQIGAVAPPPTDSKTR